jgi:UDP-N-acetylglucosamine acyltransferase
MYQPLSHIHPNASIAKNVVIEPFTSIENNVVIGQGTWIGSNVIVQYSQGLLFQQFLKI